MGEKDWSKGEQKGYLSGLLPRYSLFDAYGVANYRIFLWHGNGEQTFIQCGLRLLSLDATWQSDVSPEDIMRPLTLLGTFIDTKH